MAPLTSVDYWQKTKGAQVALSGSWMQLLGTNRKVRHDTVLLKLLINTFRASFWDIDNA